MSTPIGPSRVAMAAGAFRLGAFAARRPAAEPDPVGVPDSLCATPAGAAGLRVESVSLDAVERRSAAWRDLVARCLEPNVFLEPGFAVPAGRHLAHGDEPRFLLVWAAGGATSDHLVGLCPISTRRGTWGHLARAWTHDLAALGLPLLDRDRAAEAWTAMLDWLGAGRTRALGLLLPAVPAAGATAALIESVAETTGRSAWMLDPRPRAVLRPRGDGAGPAGLSRLSPKRAKEARRQRRRLTARGPLAYVSVAGGDELPDAVDRFLSLEAGGWKGRRGSAMRVDTSRLAFARAMMEALAREGKCRVDGLFAGGEPVAMGIVLSSGRGAFFWKMAYAEEVAACSPGVQFVLDLTERQRANPAVGFTDSCAAPEHPMIDRLWPDRLTIVDVLVGLPRRPRWRLAAMARWETAKRSARASLKRALSGLLGRVGGARGHG